MLDQPSSEIPHLRFQCSFAALFYRWLPHGFLRQAELGSQQNMRWLAQLFDFCCNRSHNQRWRMSVSNIVLNYHRWAHAMDHRSRLIAEVHIVNISSANLRKQGTIHCNTRHSVLHTLTGTARMKSYPRRIRQQSHTSMIT